MSVVFDRAVSYYDQTRGLPPQIAEWLAQAAHLEIGLSPSSRLLEIGVGTGRIALPFAQYGFRYTGVDLSWAMMDVLRGKAEGLPINLVQADITRLPFDRATFDAVIAVHVFHLVDQWAAAMDETKRVLKPGGVLLHGHMKHEDAPEHDLRMHMQERAAGTDRQDDGRLSWNEIGPQLELRFGEPQEYASPAWQTAHTPRSIIEQFAARIWSATWSLSDEALAKATEAGRAWAIERWGDLDTPFTSTYRYAWQVYGRTRRT